MKSAIISSPRRFLPSVCGVTSLRTSGIRYVIPLRDSIAFCPVCITKIHFPAIQSREKITGLDALKFRLGAVFIANSQEYTRFATLEGDMSKAFHGREWVALPSRLTSGAVSMRHSILNSIQTMGLFSRKGTTNQMRDPLSVTLETGVPFHSILSGARSRCRPDAVPAPISTGARQVWMHSSIFGCFARSESSPGLAWMCQH
ncbi:hypothetical protein DFH09DRAFT_92791 [Mycena vulgaris]|nr:hypothetical protein DFH09DRAFT_92791 [Mycena vulgaris]